MLNNRRVFYFSGLNISLKYKAICTPYITLKLILVDPSGIDRRGDLIKTISNSFSFGYKLNMLERGIPLLFVETEKKINLFYTVSPVYRFLVSSMEKMLSAIQLAPLKKDLFVVD